MVDEPLPVIFHWKDVRLMNEAGGIVAFDLPYLYGKKLHMHIAQEDM